MKISDLISLLQKIKKNEGDLNVKVRDQTWTTNPYVEVIRKDEYCGKEVIITQDW